MLAGSCQQLALLWQVLNMDILYTERGNHHLIRGMNHNMKEIL